MTRLCPDVAGIALIFTALVTPFEVAFLEAAKSPWEPLFLVNRGVDLIFVVDIVFSFMLVYQEAGGAEGTRWVEDQAKIVRHYLRGWFALDVISVLPFDFASLDGGSVAAARHENGGHRAASAPPSPCDLPLGRPSPTRPRRRCAVCPHPPHSRETCPSSRFFG